MFKRNIFKILAVVFLLLAGTSLYNPNKNKQIQPIKLIQPSPVVTVTPTPIKSTLLITKGWENPTPTNVLPVQPTPTISTNSTNLTNPTSTPQQDVINLEINGPDGNNKFLLTYKEDLNPCSILNDAKNDGKIKSVTILHYGAPLNSDYVKEINGFSDNWNFAVDGSGKPSGCSNYTLEKNSTVTWKYN